MQRVIAVVYRQTVLLHEDIAEHSDKRKVVHLFNDIDIAFRDTERFVELFSTQNEMERGKTCRHNLISGTFNIHGTLLWLQHQSILLRTTSEKDVVATARVHHHQSRMLLSILVYIIHFDEWCQIALHSHHLHSEIVLVFHIVLLVFWFRGAKIDMSCELFVRKMKKQY